jgi:hypothetical protein
VAIWYIFPRFGILNKEESGNHGPGFLFYVQVFCPPICFHIVHTSHPQRLALRTLGVANSLTNKERSGVDAIITFSAFLTIFVEKLVDVMITIFRRFLTIFGEKIGDFLENQCYDQFFGII